MFFKGVFLKFCRKSSCSMFIF